MKRWMSPLDLDELDQGQGILFGHHILQLRDVLFAAADLRDEAGIAVLHELLHGRARRNRADNLAPAHGELIVVAAIAGLDLDRQFQQVGEHQRFDIGGAADAGGGKVDRRFCSRNSAKVFIGDCAAITMTRDSEDALPIQDILVRSNFTRRDPISWL